MVDDRFDMQKGNTNRRTYAFGLYSIDLCHSLDTDPKIFYDARRIIPRKRVYAVVFVIGFFFLRISYSLRIYWDLMG